MKQLIALSILFYSTISLGANEPKDSIQLKWVLEHRPAKYFQIAAKKFKEVAEADSKGKIQVIIEEVDLKDNDLRNFRRKSISRLMQNETNIAQVYTFRLAQNAPILNVLEIPYLFEDNEHVTKVIEGEIGNELLEKASTGGLRALAFTFSGGFENIITRKKRPLSSVKDFSKLITQNFSNTTIEALNATHNMSKETNGDDYKNLKNGKIDSICVTNGDLVTVMDKAVPINYYPTDHSVLFTAITMNEKIYSSLSDSLKMIIKKASVEASKVERDAVVEDGNKGLELLKTMSFVKVAEANDPFISDLKNKLKNVDHKMSPEIQAYAKRIRNLGIKSDKNISLNQ